MAHQNTWQVLGPTITTSGSASTSISTTAAPRPATSTSKTGRRQYRSCDQCRKGKRACDIVVLDDASSIVASDGISPANGPCSNCAKTGKKCTVEWLSSTQEMLSQRQNKKTAARTTAAKRSVDGALKAHPPEPIPIPQQPTHDSSSPSGSSESIHSQDVQFTPPTLMFTDSFSAPLETSGAEAPVLFPDSMSYAQATGNGNLLQNPNLVPMTQPDLLMNPDLSAQALPYHIPPSTTFSSSIPSRYTGSVEEEAVADEEDPRTRTTTTSQSSRNSSLGPKKVPRNSLVRRRRPLLFSDPSSDTMEYRLAATASRSFISGGLMKIYHDSMENALSCWLTERTCPYDVELKPVVVPRRTITAAEEDPMLQEWGSNWTNRIVERVCRLDRVSSTLRTTPLTKAQDKAVEVSLRKAILAFATQWAQASRRSAAEFAVFQNIDPTVFDDYASTTNMSGPNGHPEFDRSMQEMFWHQAREALHETAHIESFRVIFAHIIFALTQRPLDVDRRMRELKARRRSHSRQSRNSSLHPESVHGVPFDMYNRQSTPSSIGGKDSFDFTELDEVLEIEGPPVYLETALRQIFSYRCKLEQLEAQIKYKRAQGLNTDGINFQQSDPTRSDPLAVGDRQTFNMLFWLAVMFDTLSSAMNNRPLVVSDEDSEIIQDPLPPQQSQPNASLPTPNQFYNSQGPVDPSSYTTTVLKDTPSHLWGEYFLSHHNTPAPRWPCPYPIAAATLVDAAPIKVLLYRKATRLQTLISRRSRGPAIELAIHDALSVHRFWNMRFGPFINDCVANHEALPARIQSWYVVLVGHWHLAGLLLADLIESVDELDYGTPEGKLSRQRVNLVNRLRVAEAGGVSELGRASCPRVEERSFARAPEFHHAVNKGALLSEPWTEVLVRCFARAGKVLVSMIRQDGDEQQTQANEAIVRRARYCVEALWHLGKKSDMALLASTVLLDVLREKTGTANRDASITDAQTGLNDTWEWGINGYGDADGGLGAAMAADLGTNGVGLGEWEFGEEFAVGHGLGTSQAGQVPASMPMSMPTVNMNDFTAVQPELAAFINAVGNEGVNVGMGMDVSGADAFNNNMASAGNGNVSGNMPMGWGLA